MDLAAVLRHFSFGPGSTPTHEVLRTCYKRAALAMHPDRNQAGVVGADQAATCEERWKIITNRMDAYLQVLEQKATEAQRRK
jgi:DnaJ-class molecular chaperone